MESYILNHLYNWKRIRIIFFNEVKTPFISFEFSFDSWLSKFKLFCIIYWVDIYKQFVHHTKYTHFLSTTISYFSLLWHFYGSNISCMNLCLTSILQRPHLWGGKLENRMEYGMIVWYYPWYYSLISMGTVCRSLQTIFPTFWAEQQMAGELSLGVQCPS